MISNYLITIKKFFKKILNWFKSKLPYFIVTLLILLLILVFFYKQIVITIKSGEAGVLYMRFFGGTVTDYVYPEGIHLIAPWDDMQIYNVRIQTQFHDFEVLTNRGLPIKLSLAIRFRPEYEMLAVLHQQVGPDYINTIIIPAIESILRKEIGHYNPEDIYINKDNFLTEIIMKALDELGQKFVKINDVVIRAVSLPDSIKKAIENKLVKEQQYQAYHFQLKIAEQEAKRKRIEAQGISDYHKILSKTLNQKIIKWHGIEATLKLSKSENAKIIVIGAGKDGLPIIGNIPLEQAIENGKK
jgi:regulator of protease activity HflC (stomatin/prohibitin superfamily)